MNAGRGGPLAAALALLLAGCASSDTRPTVDLREAARLNTELGVQYLQRARDDLAEPKLLRALEQDPGHAPAHAAFALWLQRQGEAERAEVHYREALRLDPGLVAARNNYGIFLCRQGRSEAGLAQLLGALRAGAAEADIEANLDACLDDLDAAALQAAAQAAARLGDTALADVYRRQLDARKQPSATPTPQ